MALLPNSSKSTGTDPAFINLPFTHRAAGPLDTGVKMSEPLTYSTLVAACTPGGASVMTMRTELAPAAGQEAGIAPARYVRGNNATYAFETRFATDPETDRAEAVKTVVIDSKGSSLNRVEQELSLAIRDGDPLISLTPRIQVTYGGEEPVTCLDLPHRAFDGHIRAGTVAGNAVTDHPTYRAARDSTPANARALLELSPIGLVMGAWDSTRRSHQVRLRSALVGETIGILADQSADATRIAPRGAARRDEIAPSVRLGAKEMTALLEAQEAELSLSNVESVRKAISKAGKGTTSGSALVLGSIPPSLEGLGFVSCRRILRTTVLSFSALRQLRFGLGSDGDAAVRVLLASLALAGVARSYAELSFRANCDLVEIDEPTCELDARYGKKIRLTIPDIGSADDLLRQAISEVVSRGIRWEGQVFEVVGNPIIAGGIIAEADGDRSS
jgi:CRISPR-associated protein Csb1